MNLKPMLFVIGAFAHSVSAQSLQNHDSYAAVLQRFVTDGLVDYAGLLEQRSTLDRYLEQLARIDPQALAGGSEADRMALWINAYNACAIRLVIDHYPIPRRRGLSGVVNWFKGYPVNSIQQIPNTWDRAFCGVAGRERSLNEIEHAILRPMGDPRIHFAVNCASRSCPMLADTPYVGDRLDAQLDAAVERFIADERQFRLERGRPSRLTVNKVLDWFQEDFGGMAGVGAFLVSYLSVDDRAYLEEHGDPQIAFFEYDWSLNDVAVFGSVPQ